MLVLLLSLLFTSSALAVVAAPGGELSGDLRCYLFERNYAGTTKDTQDFAIGGKLHYQTATLNNFSAGISLYTSQGLGLNNNSKGVYGLLAADSLGSHESYTSLGEYYVQGQWDKALLKIGAQELSTPW